MSIDHPDELAALRAAGRVVAETLRELARRVRPGVTTGRARRRRRRRVRRATAPAPARGSTTTSPARSASRSTTSACTASPARAACARASWSSSTSPPSSTASTPTPAAPCPVGKVRGREQRLAAAAQSALRRGLQAATAGANVGAIGAAVQTEVERRGFSVCAELTGHGIGRRIHEEPDVPNVAWDGPELTNGLVITVEPIIAAGARRRARRRRRLDDPHRRRLAVRARRAHDRDHRGRAAAGDGMKRVAGATPGRSGSAAWA